MIAMLSKYIVLLFAQLEVPLTLLPDSICLS